MVSVINEEKFEWNNEKIDKKVAELIKTEGFSKTFKKLGISEGIMKKIENTLLQIELNEDFHHAVFQGDLNKVKVLLEKGADINSNDVGGNALHYAAAFGGNTELVKFLIDKGLDVNAKGTSGGTPLKDAAFSGHIEIVKLLIDEGADVNAKDNAHGHSVLWHAAWNGYIETIQFLIDKGAEVNAKDNYGETALEIAESMGRMEAVELLKKCGAKKGSEL